MKMHLVWKRSLAMASALALVLTTPLQASEYVSADFSDEVIEEDLSEVIVEDSAADPGLVSVEDPAGNTEEEPAGSAEESAVPAADVILTDGVALESVAEVSSDEVPANLEAGDSEPTVQDAWQYDGEKTDNEVWLHVVNGNFNGEYDDQDISAQPSVLVQLEDGRTLPKDVAGIQPTRTGGEFEGWYTKAPSEVLVEKGEEGQKYSVWHTESRNGEEVEPGKPVPDGVDVLYAVFEDKETEDEADKLVEYYLDWNGINGLFGHCLTSIRSYENGEVYFTPKDAAVLNLNYRAEFDGRFEAAETDEDKWKVLEEIWAEDSEDNNFDGYKFLGWSTDPQGETIWENTPITNGMSFYAQWKKDDESSETFERVDPEAGSLEHIRIEAGNGTKFVSGTLHASKHAGKGESFTLNLFYTPVRAEIQDVTWSLEVSDKAASLADLFKPGKNAKTGEVKAGNETTVGGITAKAEGCSLTITNTDGNEHAVTVGATAKGADGTLVSANSSAMVGFYHSWNEGERKEATCDVKGSVTYTCALCEATKEEEIPALGHVYNFSATNGSHCKVTPVKEPTCTEDGENKCDYTCLRCNKGETTRMSKVPALGHDWSEEVVTPASCNKNMVTKTCQRKGCGVQESSLVPASNPQLHVWEETRRDHNTCKQDTVYESCAVCGETRKYTEAANNPHQFAYDSSMRNDCYWVSYTFKCVFGCGATQVTLKNEEGHDWSGWVTSTSLNMETWEIERVRERTCRRCGKTETEDLGTVAAGGSRPEEKPAATPTPAPEDTTEPSPAPETESAPVPTVAAAPTTATKAASAPTAAAAPTTATKAAPAAATASAPAAKASSTLASAAATTAVSAPASGKTVTADKTGVQTGTDKTAAKNTTSTTVKSTTAETKKSNVKIGWKTVKGKKYYVAKNGSLKTGWQKIGKKKYYFTKSGVMKTGLQKVGKKTYYFGKDGALKTGWQKIGKKKYYFGSDGAMKTGWQKIGKKTYYFGKDGVMKTGWQKISKKKYYFGKDGAMKTGWQKINKKKYYFGKDGVMKTGRQKIGGKKYTFDKNGVLKK